MTQRHLMNYSEFPRDDFLLHFKSSIVHCTLFFHKFTEFLGYSAALHFKELFLREFPPKSCMFWFCKSFQKNVVMINPQTISQSR